MAEFHQILRQLRQSHGMTQKQLAEKLGVTLSAVSMYERQQRRPSMELLEAIAHVFGVSIDYLHGTIAEPEESRRTAARLNDRVTAAIHRLAEKYHLSYEEVLRWYMTGEKRIGGVLRDPTADPEDICPPSPVTHEAEMPELANLTAHEREVLLAYRRRPGVRPYVDKLLDVKTTDEET